MKSTKDLKSAVDRARVKRLGIELILPGKTWPMERLEQHCNDIVSGQIRR